MPPVPNLLRNQHDTAMPGGMSPVKEETVRQLNCLCVLTGLCGLLTAVEGHADDWTTLRGRIVFSTDAPEQAPLEITRDEDFCGPFDLRNESLVVHPENRGVSNVAIFLRTKKDVPVHPSLTAAVESAVQLDNQGCRFVPRMQTLQTGQTWQATSTDTIPHNVAVYARRNNPFSQIVPQDKPLEVVFSKAESVPIRVDCSIHAWMRAYLIITDHPYAAVTNEDGEFEIRQVPPGTWTFRFWHERPGYVTALNHAGETRKLKSGNWDLEITGDVVDLGDLVVDAAMFEE